MFCRKSSNPNHVREDSSSPILLADEDPDEEMTPNEDVAMPFNEEPSEDNLQSAFEDELASRGNVSSRFEDQSSPINDVPGPFEDEDIFENRRSFEGEEPSEDGPPMLEDEPPSNDDEPSQVENDPPLGERLNVNENSQELERGSLTNEKTSQSEGLPDSERLSPQFDEEVPTNEDISPPFEDELPPLPILTRINNGMPFFTQMNKDLPVLTPMSELTQMNQRQFDFLDEEGEVPGNTKLPTLTPMNKHFQIMPQANESSQSPKRDLPILTLIRK